MLVETQKSAIIHVLQNTLQQLKVNIMQKTINATKNFVQTALYDTETMYCNGTTQQQAFNAIAAAADAQAVQISEDAIWDIITQTAKRVKQLLKINGKNSVFANAKGWA